MPREEIRCKGCGRVIRHEWYWYRTLAEWDTQEVRKECYCRDCASCMVDEHYTNHLICAFEM